LPSNRIMDCPGSAGWEHYPQDRGQTISAFRLAGAILMAGFIVSTQTPVLLAPAPLPMEKNSGKKAPDSVNLAPVRKQGAARPGPQSYAHIVRSVSARHGLKPEWVQAIIDVESGGDPLSVSRNGAMGLMQLMPHICREYNVGDPFDAGENIRAGAAYFARLFRRADGNLGKALAAYHGGPGRIFEMKLAPREPTLRFIRKILARLPEEDTKSILFPDSCKIAGPNEELRDRKSGNPG